MILYSNPVKKQQRFRTIQATVEVRYLYYERQMIGQWDEVVMFIICQDVIIAGVPRLAFMLFN